MVNMVIRIVALPRFMLALARFLSSLSLGVLSYYAKALFQRLWSLLLGKLTYYVAVQYLLTLVTLFVNPFQLIVGECPGIQKATMRLIERFDLQMNFMYRDHSSYQRSR